MLLNWYSLSLSIGFLFYFILFYTIDKQTSKQEYQDSKKKKKNQEPLQNRWRYPALDSQWLDRGQSLLSQILKVSHHGLFQPGWSTFPIANIFYSFAINENQNQRSGTSPRRFLASYAYPPLLRLLFLLNFPLDLIICRKTKDADD